MKQTVIAVIFDNSRKKVLILERQDVPVWVFPGGGVDKGEKPEEALKREVLEETGLKVAVVRKVAEYTPINKLSNHTYVYECRVEEGELQTGEETKSIDFYSITKLPESFFIIHREWLDDVLKNEKEVIKKRLDTVTYARLFKYLCKNPFIVLRFAITKFFN